VTGVVPLAFLSGLILGLALIVPIGPQNLFILQQALLGGIRRGLPAALAAGLCDTTLILAGAAGVAAIFSRWPWLRVALLWLGVGFLLWLGAGALRQTTPDASRPAGSDSTGTASPRQIALTAVAVSWGNPHAILDTVAVLGSAIAARTPAARPAFAAGAVSASWLFFLALAVAGSAVGSQLTPRAHRWIQVGSGLIMLLFAVLLARQAWIGG
jgi:L-lysine exporter family protein LysE/ArgO